MMTRRVSPPPVSDVVPDVTLMAFPLSACRWPVRWQNVFLTRIGCVRAEENGLVSGGWERIPVQDQNPPDSTCKNLRRFRRLFAGAQSRAASKLGNPLNNH